jgi:hypothetical protein
MTQLLSRVALALAMTFAAGSAGTVFAQTDQGQTGTQPPAATSDPAMEVCAVDWSTADANADGQLTEDEASEELKGQFAMIDTDKNGSISQEEYESCGKA